MGEPTPPDGDLPGTPGTGPAGQSGEPLSIRAADESRTPPPGDMTGMTSTEPAEAPATPVAPVAAASPLDPETGASLGPLADPDHLAAIDDDLELVRDTVSPETIPDDPDASGGSPELEDDDGDPETPPVRRGTVRPILVALASLVLPGLGHVLVRKPLIAALYLVPTILSLVVLGGWALAAGKFGIAAALLTPGVLTTLFAGNILVAGWRTSAAIEAVGRTNPGRVAIAVSTLLVVVTVGIPHLIAANTLLATESFLDETFASANATPGPGEASVETPEPELTEPPYQEPSPSSVVAPSGSIAPTPTPSPVIAPYPDDGGNGTLPDFGAALPWKRADPDKPWGNDGRFDLLLIGSDAGAARWSRRNDVMLLVEVDVATGKSAMIGIPRNLQNAPYPPGPARDASACGCQPGLINEMYVEATVRHPSLWPGKGAVKGIGAVRSVVSTLTGRPIDAVLIVDLVGVIRVVDAMGGIDINVPEAVIDDHYPDPGKGVRTLKITAGHHHFDGRTALAYARSRHMDSDYGRMERQQILLLAIRDQLGPSVILSAPDLFTAAKGTAWTDLPREALPALVELFGKASDAKVKQLRLTPSRYPEWMTRAWVNQIRKDIADLIPGLPDPQKINVPRPVATSRPTPKPTAKPTPKPSKKPGATPTPPPTEAPTPPPPEQPTPEPTEPPTPEPT
jgi:LCP family protein required for cell wall assembly